MPVAEKLTAVCSSCQSVTKARPNKAGSGIKTPKGWTRIEGGWRCRKCTQGQFLVRSVRLRIVGPAPDEARDKKEMYAALNAAARDCAGLANWYIRELYKADPGTTPLAREDKLPKLPDVYRYPESGQLFPSLGPQSRAALMQMVRGWYASDRFEALVLKDRQVRTFKWDDLPVPVARQSWSFIDLADGKTGIRINFAGGTSWKLAISGDGKNLSRMKMLVSGEAEAGAVSLVRRRRAKRAGESTPPPKVWVLRIAGRFPVKEATRRESKQEVKLSLVHDAGLLLVGKLAGSDDVFECPGLLLKETIVGGDKTDRMRQQDSSLIRGIWSNRKAARWAANRTAKCEARQRKIGKLLEVYAAALARWCVSHGVTSVAYDVTDRGFLPHGPWRRLADRINTSLENEGIALHVLGKTKQDDSGALAGPKVANEE